MLDLAAVSARAGAGATLLRQFPCLGWRAPLHPGGIYAGRHRIRASSNSRDYRAGPTRRDDPVERRTPRPAPDGSGVRMAFSCPGHLFETATGRGDYEFGERCHARFSRHFWPAYRAAHAGRIIVLPDQATPE